jgi:catechol-2,3-dioxygenase
MLKDADAMATIAVKDLEAAKKFYGEKIGLPILSEQRGVLTLGSGKAKITVYVSQYAGTNKATSATWVVPDAEAEVNALKSKGVTFEHYDNLPGLTRKGDLHVAGTFKGAWVKDPDGNILHILSV